MANCVPFSVALKLWSERVVEPEMERIFFEALNAPEHECGGFFMDSLRTGHPRCSQCGDFHDPQAAARYFDERARGGRR